MDCTLKGIPFYHGFSLIRDFPLQGISLSKECFPYKGFPFLKDFPVEGISLSEGLPFTQYLPL